MSQDGFAALNMEWGWLCCLGSPATALACMHGRFRWEKCHNEHAYFGWHLPKMQCKSTAVRQDRAGSHGLCIAGIIVAPQGVNVQPQGINIQPTVGLSVSLPSLPLEAQNVCLKGFNSLPRVGEAKTCRQCLLRLARRIRQLWRQGRGAHWMHAWHNAGIKCSHAVTCRPDVVLSHAADLCGPSGQLSHSRRRVHWANPGAPLNLLPDHQCVLRLPY